MVKQVRISDIAKAAGVSAGTVSNALNNRSGLVSKEVQKKIIKIAAEMGYLQQKRTNRLRLVIFQELFPFQDDNAFFSKLLAGIKDECKARSQRLIVNHMYLRDYQQGMAIFDDPMSCDGVMILGTFITEENLSVFSGMKLPHVFLDVSYSDQVNNYVVINNASATYDLTRRLIKAGIARIGFAGYSLYIHNIQERKAGYLSALHDCEIEHEDIYDLRLDPENAENMQANLTQIQRLSKTKKGLPQAYVCGNDFIAIALKGLMSQLGISIHITGFDDIAGCDGEGLTTISVNKEDLGKAGVRRLLDLVEDPGQSAQKISVSTRLIVRGSLLNIL